MVKTILRSAPFGGAALNTLPADVAPMRSAAALPPAPGPDPFAPWDPWHPERRGYDDGPAPGSTPLLPPQALARLNNYLASKMGAPQTWTPDNGWW